MAPVPQSSPANFIIERARSIHAMPELPPTDDLVIEANEPIPLPEDALIPLPPSTPRPTSAAAAEAQSGLRIIPAAPTAPIALRPSTAPTLSTASTAPTAPTAPIASPASTAPTAPTASTASTAPTAPTQWPPNSPGSTQASAPRSLDLGSAELGSEAWAAAIGEPHGRKSTYSCPNLAELRFDASDIEACGKFTIDVPRTPPPVPDRVGPPPMEQTDCTRPLPEIVHTRSLGGSSRAVGAPKVTGVDPRPQAPPRTPSAVPRAALGQRKIKERSRTEDVPSVAPLRPATAAVETAIPTAVTTTRAIRPPTRDLPAVQHRKAEAFYQEALESMAGQDYPGAARHLTVALTFAPGDPRYTTALEKVRRVLHL